jgi:hypothetical protein
MENRQIGSKPDKNMCFRHIKNFGQKITQFENSKVRETEVNEIFWSLFQVIR